MQLTAIRRLFFEIRYRFRRTPWDTGRSPPELQALIQGRDALPPGRMLDLGCGTGLNLVYAAQHGWTGSGIDFVPSAVRQAQRRARAAGVDERAHFFQGDVTALERLPLEGPYDLLFDLGCFHGLSAAQRLRYVRGAAALARPGATLLLYAFCPRIIAGLPMGLEPDAVRAALAPAFQEVAVVRGTNPAYWYTYKRSADGD